MPLREHNIVSLPIDGGWLHKKPSALMYDYFICREWSENWIIGRILKLGMEKLGDHVKTRRAGSKEVRFRD